MNNNLRRTIFVLFVVSALLLMIGSVSANAVDLNENLEASSDLDEGISLDDVPSSNPDNKVSNQLTISNIDEETDTSEGIGEDLSNLNSGDVVSNYEDAIINAKDSDKNLKAANNLGANSFEIKVKPLNDSVKVGEIASFEVVGISHGDSYQGIIPIYVQYNEEELHFVGYDVGVNYDIPPWMTYDMASHITHVGYVPSFWDQQKFEYNCWDIPFGEGFYFNITVNFEAKKAGYYGTNVLVDLANGFSGLNRTTITDVPPEFILENKVLTPLVNVGDTVAFEFFGRNIGGPFTDQYVPINIQYDEKELHCIGYAIGVNPDVPDMDFTNNYQVNPGFDGTYDNIQVLYDCGRNFATGHCFNFTLFFRVVNDENPTPGCHAYMFPGSDLFVEATNTTRINPESSLKLLLAKDDESTLGEIITLDGNHEVTFTKTAKQQFVNPGDAVDFVVYLENTGEGAIRCPNGILTLYDYYPTDGFVYVSAEVDSESTHAEDISVRKIADGYVQITRRVQNSLFNPGEILKVVLHFTAQKNGILCNHMFFNDLKEKNHITGSVVSGKPDLNLTKTVQEDEVELNGDVFFDIVVENNGKIPYYDHANQLHKLIIEDVYPDALVYVGYKDVVMTQDKGTIEVDNSTPGTLKIIYTFDDEKWHPDTERRFEPGQLIKVTLQFKAVDYGTLVNNASVYWNYKDWGKKASLSKSDDAKVTVREPKFTIEKIASSDEVKVGEMVTFKIVYTNTGTKNLTGVYIIDNEYSEGLEYSDFSDKSLWTFDGKDTWKYNGVLGVGESAVLELTFKATSTGEKTNTAVAGNDFNNESNSTDSVLVKDNDTNPLGNPNDDEEDIPEDGDTHEDEDVPDETSDSDKEISGDKPSPVKKLANIPATGNPLFVLIICLLSLCFVPLRGKK